MKIFTVSLFLMLSLCLSAQSSQNWNWVHQADQADEVSLILLGDTNIQNREDPASGFQYIAPTLKAADIRFCNLEGALAGTSPDPKQGDISHKFSWKHSDPAMVEGLVAAGFDVVGVANNVTYPYTDLMKSLQVLQNAGIQAVGGGENIEVAHRPVIIEKKGTRIGFLQYACTVFPFDHAAGNDRPGIAEVKVITTYQAPPNLDKPAQPPIVQAIPDKASLARMQADIRELKTKADIVIASYHWGVSNTFEPAAYQRKLGRAAIEAGADLVFGHGPHKIQAIETWRDRPIFYSVGNSVFDWWKGRPSLDGLMVRLVTKGRALQQISFVPLRRDEQNDPVLYSPSDELGQRIIKKILENNTADRARIRFKGSEAVIYDAAFREPVPSLTPLWESKGFQAPECAVFDPQRKVLYISNIGADAPGDGFISKLGMNGEIKKLHWIDGLTDPKGMDIKDHFLYVNDKDHILKIDVRQGEVVEKYQPPGVVFLNDLAIDADGTVFSNDSDGHQIFRIKNGKIDVFWQDRSRGRPNGIWNEKDRLLVSTTISKKLLAIDKSSRVAQVLRHDIGHGDGIEALGEKDYLITDFQGRIYYFSPMEYLYTLLDIRGKSHTADLEYIGSEQLVIVPSHKYNTVQAFQLQPTKR